MVEPCGHYTSGTQPFWYQGLALWKTTFPGTKGGEGFGLGMSQVHYIYCAPMRI